MCYNLIVKKFAALTISLCTALAALLSGGIAAFAEGTDPAETFYPEDKFIQNVNDNLGSVSDFAVNGNSYAFTSGGNIISVIEKGKTRTDYDIGSKVNAVDCADGVFYYRNGSNDTFSLPEKQPAAHVFQKLDGIGTDIYPYNYYLDDDGVLTVTNKADKSFTTLEDYSCVKRYGDVIYALNGGKLYSIDGVTPKEITDLTYSDYSAANSIHIGATAEKLLNFNIDELHFVSVKGGAYMTEVDLNNISGTVFVVGKTVISGEADAPAAGKEALLMCTTGENDGVAVILISGKCYIMNAANTESVERSNALTPPAEGHASATVSIALGYAYSSPHVSNGTKLFEIKSGDAVEVLGKILKTTSGELVRDFYKIKYVDGDGTEHVGYVPFGYISEFGNINEDPPSKTEDNEYSEANSVKTVVLIIVVVALIMIAVGYVTYVSTSGKKKKKTTDND